MWLLVAGQHRSTAAHLLALLGEGVYAQGQRDATSDCAAQRRIDWEARWLPPVQRLRMELVSSFMRPCQSRSANSSMQQMPKIRQILACAKPTKAGAAPPAEQRSGGPLQE